MEKFDRKLHDLLDDLKETLAESGGVGLAAPQIGILRRVVVVEDADDHMLELVNPVSCKPGGRAKRLGGLPQRPRKVWYGPAAQSGHRASPRPGRKFL